MPLALRRSAAAVDPPLVAASAPVVEAGLPGAVLGLVRIQAPLHRVEVRGRPVESPAGAHQRQRDDQQYPDRPELPVGAGDDPDRRAEDEQAERAAGLLDEPPRQLGTPLGVAGGPLAGGARAGSGGGGGAP